MVRKDCWMSFSQALEQYLTARDMLTDSSSRESEMDTARQNMKEAVEHMDALTALPEKG